MSYRSIDELWTRDTELLTEQRRLEQQLLELQRRLQAIRRERGEIAVDIQNLKALNSLQRQPARKARKGAR